MAAYRRVFQKNSYYFLTVVTYRREKILIKNIKLLRESFQKAKELYPFEIFAIVVLDDHFHMIIKPEDFQGYPKIISQIKRYFSKNVSIKRKLTPSQVKKRELGIWQRRFYEHTIRNEKEFYGYLDYIHYNPVKHQFVKAVKDWEYSSFHKFVKGGFYEENWGSFQENVEVAE